MLVRKDLMTTSTKRRTEGRGEGCTTFTVIDRVYLPGPP